MGMDQKGILEIRTWARRLGFAARRAKNLAPVWASVGDDVAMAMASQFATAGAAGGSPWAPLKPSYLAWKVAHGYDPRTLIMTGAMKGTLTSRPMEVERYFAQAAEWGTTDEKYPYHHFGTSRMPQRRVLTWFEPLESRVATRVLAYIYEGRLL